VTSGLARWVVDESQQLRVVGELLGVDEGEAGRPFVTTGDQQGGDLDDLAMAAIATARVEGCRREVVLGGGAVSDGCGLDGEAGVGECVHGRTVAARA